MWRTWTPRRLIDSVVRAGRLGEAAQTWKYLGRSAQSALERLSTQAGLAFLRVPGHWFVDLDALRCDFSVEEVERVADRQARPSAF